MALQSLMLINELSSGNPTGEVRSLKSTDDFTFPQATSTFTNTAGFSEGITLAAGKAIVGAGALDLTATGADFTLRSTTGDIIARLGDASGAKKFKVQDSGGSGAVFTVDSDGNLVINGNVTVGGTIQFSAGATAITQANQTSDDPLLILAASQAGSGVYDIGFIGERGDDTNVGFIWDESADQFACITTTSTGTETGNVTISAYADFKAANITSTSTITATTAMVSPVYGCGSATNLLLKAGSGGGGSKVSFVTNTTSEFASIDTNGRLTISSMVLNSSTAITSIDTDLSGVSGSHDTLPTAKSVKDYVDGEIAGVGSPSLDLDDLTDVAIAGVAEGDFLQYTGAGWENVNSPVMAAEAEALVAGYPAVAGGNAALNNCLFVMVNDGAGGVEARLPNPASGSSFALSRINGVWRTGGLAVRHDHCNEVLVEDGQAVAVNDPLYASTVTKGRVTIAGGIGFPGAGAFKVLVGYSKAAVAADEDQGDGEGTDIVIPFDLLLQPPVQL